MAAAPPRQERRRNRRFAPSKVRVFLVSGEFDELYTTVNFARNLLNIGSGGCCLETTGRLRPDVKMSVEVRFDDLNGTLRTAARIVWVDTQENKGEETHRAGLIFTGELEATQPIRAYLRGEDPSRLLAEKRAEYRQLKSDSQARKEGAGNRRAGPVKKSVVGLSLLLLIYAGSFWTFVLLGRTSTSQPGLHFRYLQGGAAEAKVARFYGPALWAFQKLGIPLVDDRPE